ncbi:prephenate dehydratase [Desulfohalovibrio reitneri]|uniref:prephenate dehydratase n=1 Tax=Desulfohalovibrio reitneri TaxID=1307759 RepID=UPI00054D8DB2|nr:prephenate dehydratase [Desulfohalovibrio reitneri]
MSEDSVLASVRREIDAIDEEIVELLNRRAQVSKRVGRIKSGGSGQVFKPGREEDLLAKLARYNQGPLPLEHLRAVYREIISSSRSLQRALQVVYLGPEGTFSYFAGLSYLGSSCEYTPRPHIEGVFASVASGKADLGVVPLENSRQGSVGQSLDCFMEYDVTVQAEAYARISHALLAKDGDLSAIKRVHSHHQPLEQCAGWLRANLPHAELIPADSTAAAARTVARGRGTSAAVGHVRLAELHGLNVLASPIEDAPENWTRFFIISRTPNQAGGNHKTSILFTTLNKPGALAGVLDLLASEGINLTKLESRPIRGRQWRYAFFADLECDLLEDRYAGALEKLRSCCASLKLLGAYPAGPRLETARQENGEEEE